MPELTANVTPKVTPKSKPQLLTPGSPPLFSISPSITKTLSVNLPNQQNTPGLANDYSFYFKVLAVTGISATLFALIVLQSTVLKPVLACTVIAASLGYCFFKNPLILEQTEEFNDLSVEIEKGARYGLLS